MDSQLIGDSYITHTSAPLCLQVRLFHPETIILYVISSPANYIFLGFTWLQTHDHQVSWKQKELIHWSSHGLQNCLPSCLPYLCWKPGNVGLDRRRITASSLLKIKMGDYDINYQWFNTITVRFPFLLPLVPSALEQLWEVHYFTKIDLRYTNNLIRIKEGNEWKTAFHTTSGHSLMWQLLSSHSWTDM